MKYRALGNTGLLVAEAPFIELHRQTMKLQSE
jgi:hypothetical protein